MHKTTASKRGSAAKTFSSQLELIFHPLETNEHLDCQQRQDDEQDGCSCQSVAHRIVLGQHSHADGPDDTPSQRPEKSVLDQHHRSRCGSVPIPLLEPSKFRTRQAAGIPDSRETHKPDHHVGRNHQPMLQVQIQNHLVLLCARIGAIDCTRKKSPTQETGRSQGVSRAHAGYPLASTPKHLTTKLRKYIKEPSKN